MNHLIRPVGLAVFLAIASASARGGTMSFATVADQTLLSGAPLIIPLDGLDSGGLDLTYTAAVSAVSGSAAVSAAIPEGNRSLQIDVTGFGTMKFQLFEDLAPRATGRVISLAQSGFYSGVTFHRVIDNFMIQGGDPTGTGGGGSTLGKFNDQFNVDLQHTSSGVLSMAKSFDDTNDSQFFITEAPTRWLDFQHTIFGHLTEGEAVRQAISNVPVDGNSKPLTPVVMNSVTVFRDRENGVLMLKAPEGTSGVSNVTVTAQDTAGHSYQQTFKVTVSPDPHTTPAVYGERTNSDPFLKDIPEIVMPRNGHATYQLQAVDAEGDAAYYLDQWALNYYKLSIPVVADANLDYSVDMETGQLTIDAMNGMYGAKQLTVATGMWASTDRLDYQVVDVIVYSVLGDANLDNTVDLQDFGAMKDNFNLTGMGWRQGDFNGDGLVDLQDFGILKSNFGLTGALTAVPEPGSLIAMIVGAAGVVIRRKKNWSPR